MSRLLDLTHQAETNHFWFHGFRQFVAPVVAQVADGRTGLRLLDCGCGTGTNMGLLAPHGRSVGFDLSDGGLAIAKTAGRAVAKGDVTSMPIASDSCDVVASFDVLQCVADDRAALREIARVTKPGGVVVLTLAALEVLSGDHAEVWQEQRRYSPSLARERVEQAGLQVERATFMFGSLFPVILCARVLQRMTRPFRTVRDDIDIAVPPYAVNWFLSVIVRAEAALARRVPMPFGSSLLVVARKPK
jgi:ubiquinone/menaquinone biosynthesis C-methylase UbiE